VVQKKVFNGIAGLNVNLTSDKKAAYNKLFLPSLVVSSFATGPITVLSALLLIDIGYTFNITSVGIVGQVNTTYSIAAVVFAFSMSVLSIRFKHKALLLAGLLLMTISALGCFLASDFIMVAVFYSLSGAGYAMVSPMTVALVGEHFALEKRANAIGWIIAGGSLVYVIGAPLIALMSGFGGWRLPLLGFVVPVLVIGFLLAFLGLPSARSGDQGTTRRSAYLRSFKEILMNRSAVACLVGDVLRSAAFVAVVLYAASFIRQRFLVETDLASIVLLGGALCYALGSLVSGMFVNRFGRKSSTVLTALLSGIFTISYVFASSLWLSVALIFVASWFFGMVASAANSLTLEQISGFRGTMMSMDYALINVGSALGSVVGWLALSAFDYEGLGSALGAMGILAGIVFVFLAIDPTRAGNVKS
jgi:predicted MFS family arabinose efflux permease